MDSNVNKKMSKKRERFKGLRLWYASTRPKFFTATILPVLLGAAIAWYQHLPFSWLHFTLTMTGALCIHAGLDLVNDYYGYRSKKPATKIFPTAFNGGSRYIQDELLTPKQIIRGGLLCFLTGIAIGFYLNYVVPGNYILIIGAVGVALAFLYTVDPFRIGHSGFREVAVGIGFGPVMVLGSYFVQAHRFSMEPFIASVPVGILIALVLYINAFPDYDTDKAMNKLTSVVRLGKKRAIKVYIQLLRLVFIWVALGVCLTELPFFALGVFLTVPLYLKAVSIAKTNYDNSHELSPVNAATSGLHLIIGVLLIMGFILDKLMK